MSDYSVSIKQETLKLSFPESGYLVSFEDGTRVAIKEEPVIITADSETLKVVTMGQAPDWTFQTKITVSGTAPTAPRVGDVWFDNN